APSWCERACTDATAASPPGAAARTCRGAGRKHPRKSCTRASSPWLRLVKSDHAPRAVLLAPEREVRLAFEAASALRADVELVVGGPLRSIAGQRRARV